MGISNNNHHQQWKNVTDGLPDEKQKVALIYNTEDNEKNIVCGHRERDMWYVFHLYTYYPLSGTVSITHWTPLPECP